MNSPKNKSSWEFRWRIIVIYVILMVSVLGLIVVTFLTDLFHTPKEGQVPPVVWLLLAGAFLLAIIATLANVIKIFDTIQDNSTKLEVMTETLKNIQAALTEINQSTHLSEAAKAILLRDEDQQSLREAVLDKIKQQDFETANEIIEAIGHRTGYKELAEHLRDEMDKHRSGTEQVRMKQAVAAVEKLFESHEWVKAGVQIEKIIKAHPGCEEAKALRVKLIDKKEERKKVLLNAWDDAVKRRATDRSLEILKELDLYLTPQEAVNLQEAASDVFKEKLHNLGIQFSLAVSGEQWDKAIQVGQQIMHDFPNSRMSEEIREKMDILKQKVELQNR